MKTRSTAVLLAVIIALTTLCISASADTWPNFGTTTAGSNYNQPITDADGAVALVLYDENADGVPDTALPSGLNIESEIDPVTGPRYYLRGIPQAAGDYSFTLAALFQDSSFQLLHCTLRIDPPAPLTPVVISSQDILCNINEEASVSVNASSVDGGALGYQWYVNSVPTTEGGLAIIGAINNSYTASTTEAGDSYYYCYVTNTINGSSVGTYSPVIRVLVRGVSSVSVMTMPVVTKYSEGDALNTLGLQIEAMYSDGTTEVISDTSILGIFPLVFDEAGEQDVTVSYKGKTCSFKVEVEKSKDIVEIVNMPYRTSYEVGDSVDISGLVLKVTKKGQETLVNDGFNWSPKIVTAEGSRTITVILADGNSITFNVSVAAGKKDQSIKIETLPDKLNYKVGDRLDTRGLTITVITNKDSRVINSGYSFSPTTFTEANENQTVTVKYGTFTATFTVSVESDEPAAVTPSPTVNPSSGQTGTEFIRVTPPPAEHREENGTPVIIIILAVVIAFAAIGGAVVYIVMARSSKKAAVKEEAREKEPVQTAPSDTPEPEKVSATEASEPETTEEAGTEDSPETVHHSGLEPDKKDYFEGLFDDDEIK